MLRHRMRFGIALSGVFVGLILLVEGLGHLTWYLSPRDVEAIRQASEFEAIMSTAVHTPKAGSVPGLTLGIGRAVTNRDSANAVHRVAEWPVSRGRDFRESPLLRKKTGLPPVGKRLPENPLVMVPPHQIGPYGGTWQRFGTGPQDIGVVRARLAYDGLVRWDPMGNKIIPNLASRWAIEDGGKTYVFWLRKGVRWSDGHPFTANDILFWYEHVLKNTELTPVIPRDFMRGGKIVQVKKLDEYTVAFRFKEPNGLLLQAMASGRGYEVTDYAAHYMRQFHPDFVSEEKLSAMIQASGFEIWARFFMDKHDWRNVEMPRLWPWLVTQPPPARPVIFERNPYYWKVDPEGNQLPYIDRMTFDIYDLETINLKAINGEVGMQTRHLDLANYPLFMANQKKGGYRVLHWLNGKAVEMNLHPNMNHKDETMRKLLEDRRFRIALSHAIDRDALNEVGYFGIGEPRQNAPPPFSAYYSEAYAKAHIEYDPALANKLLDEMGLKKRNWEGVRLRPDGEPLSLSIDVRGFDNNVRLLELVASDWRAAGVKTEVKSMARQLFSQRKTAMVFDFSVWGGADAQYPLLNPRWFFPWGTNSWQAVNYGRWFTTNGAQGESPPPDIRRCMDLFRQIEKTPDENAHLQLFGEIIDLNRKNLWIIGLIGGMPSIVVVKNSFRNVPEVATSGWVYRTPGNTGIECYAIEE